MCSQNYESVTGENIDDLWQVADLRNLAPQWHSYSLMRYEADDSDEDMPQLQGLRGKRQRLALKSGEDDEDEDGYSSLPPLQEVSNSSDEGWDSSEPESSEDEDEDEHHEESEYDTDEEDLEREWEREMMDAVTAMMDYEKAGGDDGFDALAEERKGNPFLKLLGSLRGMFRRPLLISVASNFVCNSGRMFSSSPTLKTTSRTEPRRPAKPGKPAPPPPTAGESKSVYLRS